MRRLKKITSIFVSVLLILCLASSCTTSPETTTTTTTTTTSATKESTTEPRETIELSVFVSLVEGGDGTAAGIQTDPVSKYIEEQLGIKINLTNVNVSVDAANVLATYMASNDLPDICFCGYGAQAKQNLETMVTSGQIIPLDELISKNAPYLSTNESWILRLSEVKKAFGVGGKLYSIPRYTEDSISTVPGNGNFVRWDLYSQIGHPSMETNDEIISGLKAMLALEPVNNEGLTNFATGAWFADEPGWGTWVLFEGAIQDRGFTRIYHTTFVDVDGQKVNEKDALSDPNSIIWNNVDLYYKLNKEKLLDPDSMVQKYDQWKEKLSAGRYIMTTAGWTTGGFKPKFQAMGKPDASFMPLAPPEGSSGSVLAWMNIINDQYVISSKCEYPDRAIQLMDFMSTDEVARIASSGIEGVTWNYDDNGIPAYTSEFLSELSSNPGSIMEKYGIEKYNRFISAKDATILSDGEFANLMQSPRYNASTYNASEKDYLSFYKVNNILQVFTKTDKIFYWEEAQVRIPAMSEELALAQSDLENYVYNELPKLIYAKDDTEFKQMKDAWISGLSNYKVQEIHEFYKSNFEAKVAELKPIIEPLEVVLNDKLQKMIG